MGDNLFQKGDDQCIIKLLLYKHYYYIDIQNELVTKVIIETAEQIEIDKIKEAQRSEIDEESEMEVGLRVRRGKDWMWGDQDGNGTGTVIGHKSRGRFFFLLF